MLAEYLSKAKGFKVIITYLLCTTLSVSYLSLMVYPSFQ